MIVRPWALESIAAVAQLVERVLGKDEVMSSSLISSFFVAAAMGWFELSVVDAATFLSET